jgi:hypothetical protein
MPANDGMLFSFHVADGQSWILAFAGVTVSRWIGGLQILSF